jgi:glycosyltransferase involved in cell wall biosynthesis
MKISLIVSTYNWPDALRLCLDSIKQQTRMPDEVIIADDGSGDKTRQLIAEESHDFPCPLYHAWIPDLGFRLAKSRNNAFRQFCTGDYVIFIDQDIILDRRFVDDHEHIAQRGYFVAGGRTKLMANISQDLLHGMPRRYSIFNSDIHRKINGLHALWLHPITRYLYSWNRLYGRGANMAMWAEDLRCVNGFDERIQGYGVEDVDLFNRLENLGIRKKYAQFCAIEHHLYHKRGKVVSENHLLAFQQPDRTWCRFGLQQS